VTALGVALAACGNSSDPVGNVASGPATGDAAKIEAADLNTGTIEAGAVATATLTVPEGTTKFVCTFHSGMTGTIEGVAQAEG
jgi:plastocyanin